MCYFARSRQLAIRNMKHLVFVTGTVLLAFSATLASADQPSKYVAAAEKARGGGWKLMSNDAECGRSENEEEQPLQKMEVQ